MKIYTSGPDAISDLHKRGFVNDFQLIGNDLLCVQEGFFIKSGEFFITDLYKIQTVDDNDPDEMTVLGIVAPYHHMKGILLWHDAVGS